MTPTLRITPLKHAIHAAGHGDLLLVVSVSVPPADTPESAGRSALNLSLALDKSGSMGGAPLQEAKNCASRIVSALHDGDRVAVVAYDNRVERTVPATKVGPNRALILDAIREIHVGGNTDIHAGWLAAAEAAATGLSSNVLTRVMVLSDGNANVGLTDVAAFSAQAAALAAKGIATTTIGLGESFNEELMSSIAKSGGGQATYGESADDLWPRFEAELGLLSATCGKKVRLRLSSSVGAIVVSDAFVAESKGAWILPDLAYGGSISVLVRVQRGKAVIDDARAELLRAFLDYDDLDGVPASTLRAACTVNVLAEGQPLFQNDEAGVVVLENAAAAMQVEASDAAMRGDTDRVRALARRLTQFAGDNLLVAGMAKRMMKLAEEGDLMMYSKEATYGAASLSRGYRSSAPAGAKAASFAEKRTRQGKED
jgi:Ca-activated chloride channel family protein